MSRMRIAISTVSTDVACSAALPVAHATSAGDCASKKRRARAAVRHMLRLGQAMTVLTVLAVSPGLVHAGATPAQKCAAAKNKAAAKKIVSKLKCYRKADVTGTAVDPSCLLAAETKFDEAVMKAEAKGGCAVTGDGSTIEDAADTCVNNVTALTSPPPPPPAITCCAFTYPAAYCAYADALSCGGTAGPAGSVCDAATGTCVTTTPTPGDCCDGLPVYPGLSGCAVGPAAGLICGVNPGSTFHSATLCAPDTSLTETCQ